MAGVTGDRPRRIATCRALRGLRGRYIGKPRDIDTVVSDDHIQISDLRILLRHDPAQRVGDDDQAAKSLCADKHRPISPLKSLWWPVALPNGRKAETCGYCRRANRT